MQVSAFADIQSVEEGLTVGARAPDVVVEVQVVAVAVAHVNLNKQTDDETNNPSKKKRHIYIYMKWMKMLTASSQCWSTSFCALSSLESPLPTLVTLHEMNEDAYSFRNL
jgi:hypothetical protein